MALRARSAPCSRRQRLQLRRQCARGRGQQRKRRQRNRLPTGSRAHSFSCIVFMFAYLACSTQSSCFHLFHFQSHIFIFPNFLFQIRSKSKSSLFLGIEPEANPLVAADKSGLRAPARERRFLEVILCGQLKHSTRPAKKILAECKY